MQCPKVDDDKVNGTSLSPMKLQYLTIAIIAPLNYSIEDMGPCNAKHVPQKIVNQVDP